MRPVRESGGRVATSARRKEAGSAGDGRILRGERSRHSIVDALMELVGEGIVKPTVQQVADRAGVGLRSVFRHFNDFERLYAEMDERLSAEVAPALLREAPRGALRERALGLVATRVTVFERIAPYRRAGVVQRWRSPYLAARNRALVRALRTQILAWLPELASAPGERIDALDLWLSFEAWDRLRTDQGLSRERARAVVEHGTLALLGRR